jgi:hypothetical protein
MTFSVKIAWIIPPESRCQQSKRPLKPLVLNCGGPGSQTEQKPNIALWQTAEGLFGVYTESANSVCDGEVLSDLLGQVESPLVQLTGDGSYDQGQCYEALQEYQERQRQPLRVTIPPQRGAALWHQAGQPKSPQRDTNLKRIGEIGRRRWKRESGYYRQSKIENAMFRYKSLIGDKLRARTLERQIREAFTGCMVLNLMTALGMPDSYVVT